jgi:hypothetical protein
MLFTKLQSELLVSSLDVESSMAYVSAIREIADAEQSGNFAFNRKAYEDLASAIAKMAKEIDGDFAVAYSDVAERVQAHALSLS